MAFALRRILLTLPLLLVVSFLVFLVGEALPGDPAVEALQQHGTLADVEAWRHAKGLDQPLLTRYGKYVVGIVTEFDFGQRYKDDQPIGPELVARFGATFELTLFAMVLALPLGLLAGIVSAARRGHWEDYAGNVLAMLGISVPVFWLGMVLVLVTGYTKVQFRYDMRAFDDIISVYSSRFYLVESLLRGEWSVARSCIEYLLLPGIALSTIPMAVITRMTRSSMLEEVGKDYVRTAHAKGVHGIVVTLRHVLKNALIPVITIAGLQFGALLSGAVLTETVFSWPGLGTYIIEGVKTRDSPVLVGGVLLVATIFILVNLTVDLLYGVVDPRVRVEADR